MKFDITSPPAYNGDAGDYLERLSSWLYKLSERLNVSLGNLGKDNFNEVTAAKLFGEEEADDNL